MKIWKVPCCFTVPHEIVISLETDSDETIGTIIQKIRAMMGDDCFVDIEHIQCIDVERAKVDNRELW